MLIWTAALAASSEAPAISDWAFSRVHSALGAAPRSETGGVRGPECKTTLTRLTFKRGPGGGGPAAAPIGWVIVGGGDQSESAVRWAWTPSAPMAFHEEDP
ncbi:hypothetical protein EYF80_067182 [Liparis tanakae]|uniref:Uncharacterized protein n=1 Tax=Liparis tanakae TaxID=230148 RepID=A0A4Z2E1T3_9TELE|nr:hypothetical protein EYF80_067182 [Liparis tanakae]